ncbi:TPM domain-containing protein [Patescibacteria group bacterium]|nr:TPM domain-containing protein [Patescibacteria group bacterium]
MKKLFKIGLLFLFLVPSFCFSLEIPKLNSYINDNTNTLNTSQKNELESLLGNFDNETSNQIVVLIINSLENEALEDYSIRVAEENKIGQEEKDNGLLLLIVKEDKVMRIEVGYGLEGYVTDAKSSYIIRNIIAPEFQKENYYQGIKNGLVEIIQLSEDANYLNDKVSEEEQEIPIILQIIFFIIFAIVIIRHPWLLLFLGGRGGGSGRGGSFGGFKGGGGGFGGGGSSGRW